MNQDRVVVVTGGASGIGQGVARRFASKGHPVALFDMQEELLEGEARLLRQSGAKVVACKVDVADRSAMERAYELVRAQLGPVSIVIANAGISGQQAFPTMTLETWQRMIDVNLTGVFNTVQLGLADMLERKWGRIVTISSQAAQSGAPNRVHYAAAKGGVISFTKALALEVAALGITVNTIPPSLVDTPLARKEEATGEYPPVEVIAQHVPIPRAGTPDDIADACEFLCSDQASYITAQQINVNGGMYR